jgi:hypothetical protein
MRNSVCRTDGIKRNSAEWITVKFCVMPRNSAKLNSYPHKIPYSAEFQKVTSVNTLVRIMYWRLLNEIYGITDIFECSTGVLIKNT